MERAITWTENATGSATAILASSTLSASRTTATLTQPWRWAIAQARNGTSIAYPLLPTDLGNFNISPTDTCGIVSVSVAQTPGTYDSVRPIVFDLTNPAQLIAASGGRVVVEEFLGSASAR